MPGFLTSELLVHGANVLFVCSYLIRDILWLRLLTVFATMSLMAYYLLENIWVALGWGVLHLAINAYQITRLVLERRPVRLPPREERLYRLAFRGLTPREFLLLVGIGTWRTEVEGTELVAEGTLLDELRVISTGQADVVYEGATVATLNDGSFVGEMSYLTGDVASAVVTTACDTTCLVWERKSLDALLASQPNVCSALQHIVGADLARKLRRRSEPT